MALNVHTQEACFKKYRLCSANSSQPYVETSWAAGLDATPFLTFLPRFLRFLLFDCFNLAIAEFMQQTT